MKVITEGHKYQLDGFEDPDNTQEIQFIHKEPASKETHPEYWEDGKVPGEGILHMVSDGTTNEEVLRMLVNRLQFLYDKLPDTNTRSAIDHCEHALHELEARTTDREIRKVEGTHQA